MQRQTSDHADDTQRALAATFPALPPRAIYLTVEQFSERNQAFTPPAVRNLIFKAETRRSSKGEISGNGLLECGAILRIGRKVLIDEGRFFDWVRRQNGKSSRVTVESTTSKRLQRRRRSPEPVCQQCGGSGTDPNTSDQCERCRGSGYEPDGD